jgi:hypothetical protein
MSDRAEFVLTKTPLGAVVREGDEDGRKWIFVGWSSTTAGWEMNFVRAIKPTDRAPAFTYHASMADTLIRKFPALEQYRKPAE